MLCSCQAAHCWAPGRASISCAQVAPYERKTFTLRGGGQADVHLLRMAVGDLPGIGWATRAKLEGLGICSVADVRARSCERLQRELGAKTGAQVGRGAFTFVVYRVL